MNPLLLNDLVKFSFLLFLAAGASYGIHYGVFIYLNPGETLDLINFAYKFNIGITLLFTSTIILASEHLKEQLGFIFLISGFVKLAIFIYLIKTSDFSLEKSVFLHFFAPYVVCMIVEIFYIIKILNRTNFSNDS
ncbi:hypothetical protein [Salinimicrobium xinjiangense]|uniref:hypothetical protein n=1 Tax=Salinimicrobium xinjiangense TaxID=438596 RepID=UPI0003FE94CD|nr:hypothetical protein [Salinimicrobium xinjiangense]